MGTKRMGSQGASGSRGINGAMPGGIQEPKSGTLSQQGSSMYNLTLDEVQSQLGDLGKPISSMNLDELLRTVWSVEENESAVVGAIEYAASSNLSKKTVDEVWKDIQQQKRNNINLDVSNERQLTLGEMTLEEFLVKAGAVAESNSSGKGNLDPQRHVIQQQSQWMSYQIPPPIHQQQQQQQNMVFLPGQASQQTEALPIPINPMMDVSNYPESQMGTLSDTQTPGRKRVVRSGDVVVERTVERRQKRMIKNRESAARSRARKQAYTHELENKVTQLEEENERLKRKKELEKALPCLPLPEPKYQLRRTSSALF